MAANVRILSEYIVSLQIEVTKRV